MLTKKHISFFTLVFISTFTLQIIPPIHSKRAPTSSEHNTKNSPKKTISTGTKIAFLALSTIGGVATFATLYYNDTKNEEITPPLQPTQKNSLQDRSEHKDDCSAHNTSKELGEFQQKNKSNELSWDEICTQLNTYICPTKEKLANEESVPAVWVSSTQEYVKDESSTQEREPLEITQEQEEKVKKIKERIPSDHTYVFLKKENDTQLFIHKDYIFLNTEQGYKEAPEKSSCGICFRSWKIDQEKKEINQQDLTLAKALTYIHDLQKAIVERCEESQHISEIQHICKEIDISLKAIKKKYNNNQLTKLACYKQVIDGLQQKLHRLQKLAALTQISQKTRIVLCQCSESTNICIECWQQCMRMSTCPNCKKSLNTAIFSLATTTHLLLDSSREGGLQRLLRGEELTSQQKKALSEMQPSDIGITCKDFSQMKAPKSTIEEEQRIEQRMITIIGIIKHTAEQFLPLVQHGKITLEKIILSIKASFPDDDLARLIALGVINELGLSTE